MGTNAAFIWLKKNMFYCEILLQFKTKIVFLDTF